MELGPDTDWKPIVNPRDIKENAATISTWNLREGLESPVGLSRSGSLVIVVLIPNMPRRAESPEDGKREAFSNSAEELSYGT